MTGFAASEFMVLAYGGIFLGVLVAFEGVRQILTRSETMGEVRNRRMRMIAQGASAEQMLNLLKPAASGGWLSRVPLIGTLPRALIQSGIKVRAPVFLATCIAATCLVAAIAATRIALPAAIGLGTVLCLGLPLWLLENARTRRNDQLIRQLPDALDLMARGLRVGHPLQAAIGAVARDMPDPIASEFGILIDQVSFGDDLVGAFADLANRLDLEDVRYLAVSVAIQHGTGGNLGNILHTLAQVIRDRITMRKRIRAISSEGRMTSIFMSLLPLFILASTSITAPDYYLGVKDDPLFRPFAMTVASLIVVNYFAMRKLVNFRF